MDMELSGTKNFLRHINNPHLAPIQRIQSTLLHEMQSFAREQGFVQLMPIMMSPFTDPLNHDVYPAEIQYRTVPLKLTASMIFHKQLALIRQDIDRIFIVSPNIRLEKPENKTSKNHLLEFSQFDIEMRDAGMEDVMVFLESLLVEVFRRLESSVTEELSILGRSLPRLKAPFPRYSSDDLRERYGEDFYRLISEQTTVPCFVTNFKREFYDREDPERPGTYRNFDLIYPQGYGEALSGAEREYLYDDILRRMKELGMNLEAYANYLDVARQGLLPRTAGAGIGIQRLVKFICGKQNIAEVCLFDRSVASDFVF
jgi:asparaginyl-tRNA synthetase